ncbi:hypothetical protein Barb7_00781 [Bacteroidales bacterium Barb7]|nr:hypothetical protein Barb7_00781 [Bacteroidales bacterium Barb7]
MLCKVGESHDVTRLIESPPLVGNPHLHAVNRHLRRNRRQKCHRLVIRVMEIMPQKEMPVLVILVSLYLKRLCLHAAL